MAGSSYQHGYDERRFADPVREDLFCSICQCVLREPRTCRNREHPFCLSCISQHLRNSHTCPECRDDLTPETLKTPRFLKNILSEMEIKCEFVERGCPEYVLLGNLQNHTEKCGFAPAMCANEGCGMALNKKDKEIHEKELCQFRIAKCHDCRDIKKNVNELKATQNQLKASQDKIKENIEAIKKTQAEMREDQVIFEAEVREQFQTVADMLIELLQARNVNNTGAQATLGATLAMNPTNNQDIIILGGYYAETTDNISSRVEKLNIAKGRSSELPPMNKPPAGSASCVYNGEVIVTGGWDGESGDDSIEILNMNQQPLQWKMFRGKLPFKLFSHTVTVYHNNMYVVGGHNSNENKTSDEIHELSLTPPYTAKLLAIMPQARRNHRAEIVNHELFIFGGTTTGYSKDAIDSVEVYDFITKQFKTCTSLPRPLCRMSTVTWGNKIIVIGGVDKNTRDLSDVIMYDTGTGGTERLPSLKHKRSGSSAVILDNVIVVFGGWNRVQGYLNSVESFTMGSDGWKELPGMKEKRRTATAVVLPPN